MSAPPKDTRRHRRFSVDVDVVVHAGGRHLAARTRDLSRSGICLITSAPVRRGDRLMIELTLSFGDNAFSEPLRLEAHVVWCTAISQAYQVGAMFDDLTDDHIDFLDMFLRYLDGSLTPTGVPTVPDDDEPPPSPDEKDDPFRR